MIFSKRHHLFEINDQPWWPSFLRKRVQAMLAVLWTLEIPHLQPTSSADTTANILVEKLGDKASNYVYVEFASGAGGPIPCVERRINDVLARKAKDPAHFVMTDLAPHVEAWSAIAKKSENIHYIADSVDATRAPPAEKLLKDVPDARYKKVMRMFSLSFHHFDDDLAVDVVRDTLKTSDGFCIFELQARDLTSLCLVGMLFPLLMISSPVFFFDDMTYLFFTYVIPLIPLCFLFDGWVSCLRTRMPAEMQQLVAKAVPELEAAKWTFETGKMATGPMSHVHWTLCTKKVD